MVLNSKKEAFAQAIVDGMGKEEACIHAGYSPKTARQQANRLMKDPEVVSLVTKLTKNCDKCDNCHNSEESNDSADETPANAYDGIGDPKIFLKQIMMDAGVHEKLRIEAAKALLPYEYGRISDVGKKEAQKDTAEAKAKASGLSARLAARGLKQVK